MVEDLIKIQDIERNSSEEAASPTVNKSDG